MSVPPRSIFRPTAVRQHARSQEEAVLPRFVSPRTFLCLWLLLGLLAAGILAAWSIRVPQYITMAAVIEREQGSTGLEVLAFLPPGAIAAVHSGQHLLVNLAGQPVELPILTVDPVLRSPTALRQALGLEGSDGLAVIGPSGVATAFLPQFVAGLPAADYLGTTAQVQIQVGAVRGLGLLPLVLQFFGG